MQFITYHLTRLLDLVTYPLRALLYAPQRMFRGMGRFGRISLPARVAILTFVFLLVCTTVTLIIFVQTSDRAYWQAKITWTFIGVVTALVVVIPLVLYKALKLWLEGDVSPYPDIDHAWRAGVVELEKQGLSLTEAPLFLILGTSGEEHEKAVFAASRLNFNMAAIPTGPSPLHWYANAEGVYLVCADASSLSNLASLAAEVAAENSTLASLSPRPAAADGASIRGTFVAGDSGAVPTPASPEESAVPDTGAPPGGDIRGTMAVGGAMGFSAGDSVASTAASSRTVIKLEQKEAAEQGRRLEYVCRLIRRARQPLCPINGALTLLPFGLIQRSVAEAIEVQRAVKRDLSTLLRVLMVRAPVTAVVVGLERESGFRELVRRVGRDPAMRQRFGKGFSVQNLPLPERLDALATHATGSFEDWVYALFREKGSLAKPGNTKLYSLLCKIRRNVRSRLANILKTGYGHDTEADKTTESVFFGGCYFAATGETEDRQAFMKNVFDKLPDQQEELQWTDDAYVQDEKFQMLARMALAVDTLLMAALGVLIWYKYW